MVVSSFAAAASRTGVLLPLLHSTILVTGGYIIASMAQHTVKLTQIPELEVGKRDMSLSLKAMTPENLGRFW